MSSDEDAMKLLKAVCARTFDEVKAAIEAGADVNGPREQRFPPIAAAVIAEHAGIVEFLLQQGADADKPVTCGVPGERALHIAARSGQVEIVRLLLNGSRADVNATDNRGRTPLMTTCVRPHFCLEAVRLLLEAGADPTFAAEDGLIPLHMVAQKGHTDLVDVLYSAAPATLNLCSSDRETPLFMACNKGHAGTVSKLLSLGAKQLMALDESLCPLATAVGKGFVDVVRVLMNEGGITAVGGDMAFAKALRVSVATNRPRVLRLLLTVGGEKKRSEWANIKVKGGNLLHYGAGHCFPAAVSILLEAGADEAARGPEGCIPLEVIALCCGRDEPQELGKEIAIWLMLQRGPAYRARSWAWPSDEEVSGTSDGDTAAAAAAAAAGTGGGGVVLSSSPAAKPFSVVGVRIFRTKEKRGCKFFVRLVVRYCAKIYQ